ncbi:MAG: ROK family protein [Acidobacteriota bacterium]|nr:ROK family protein [Acidobacteriota bacterium]
MKVIGAVDIGGTKIAVGAVTETGRILHRMECPTAASEGFAQAMQNTKQMLREVRVQAGADYEGIGVASPGPIDPYTGVMGEVGTLPGWQGGSIIEELGQEFGVRVSVENDADAGALGEATWGAGRNCSRLIYVTVSTGIGVGIVLSGEIYRGVDGAHPEIGHQVLDFSGPPCYCGARGCWETLASGTAMTAWIREQIREQNPAGPPLTAGEICDLARAGDGLALLAVEREGFYLGLGLANLITIFAPEAIVLGGGVMKSSALFLDGAREVIRKVATQVPAERTRVMLAELGPDTVLAGAAAGWISKEGQN